MALLMKSTSSRAASSTARPARRSTVAVRASAVPADVPDMGRRVTMNYVLGGGIGAVVLGLGGPYALFFVPPRYGWLSPHDQATHAGLQAINMTNK